MATKLTTREQAIRKVGQLHMINALAETAMAAHPFSEELAIKIVSDIYHKAYESHLLGIQSAMEDEITTDEVENVFSVDTQGAQHILEDVQDMESAFDKVGAANGKSFVGLEVLDIIRTRCNWIALAIESEQWVK